jgi:5'-methylthioadenosine phosphorylase
MMNPVIGIIGGSGMETANLFDGESETRQIDTPYGNPSDSIRLGNANGVCVAFVPRHGQKHQFAPSNIPYKANLWALRSLGIKAVVGTCIVGSLKERITPGSFLVFDQFVNLTNGRDGHCIEKDGSFLHVPMGDPYCESLRRLTSKGLRKVTSGVRSRGTVVVIQGPRFSTKAESRYFIKQGWDVVNMTQYPECLFARELGLCYAAFASVTDYDVGTGRTLSMHPSDLAKVLRIFHRNTEKSVKALKEIVAAASAFRCECAKSMIREYYRTEDQ